MNALFILRKRTRQTGFTLVEIMIAITLGLMIVAGLTTLFVNNTRTQNEIERANRQIENGRYAMQLMTEDLRHAGFYGEFDPNGIPTLAPPAALPDPCSAALADLRTAIPLHVQGYDQTAALSCVTDRRANTDVLVVRRTSTCDTSETDCDPVVAGLPYFQAALCNDTSQLGSINATDFFALDSDTANLTRQKRDCTTAAVLRRYRTHIYFIANNNEPGDGVPTLKRVELDTNGANPVFKTYPLVEGIENLQIEYGMDPDKDGKLIYNADPSTYASCVGAACITNWQNVMAVKLHILSRSLTTTAGYTDPKTYTLGLTADGDAFTITPNDGYKRNVFQGVTGLVNPIGRR